jgi:hypothetical protein
MCKNISVIQVHEQLRVSERRVKKHFINQIFELVHHFN